MRRQVIGLAAALMVVIATGCSNPVAPARFQIQLSASLASIPADGTSTITAHVTNSRGQTPPGMVIEWSNSLAALEIRNGATDNNGRASATLSGQGAHGVAVITAVLIAAPETRDQVEIRIGLD